MKLLPCLLLLLFVGCAAPRGRPTFANCMTGPKAIDHGMIRPAFKDDCRMLNIVPGDTIDMRDVHAFYGETHEKIKEWRQWR